MENNRRNNMSQTTGSSSGMSSQSGQGTSGKGGLGNITSKLQQYSEPITEKINHMSTTQKVVGGAILALGAGWLAMGSKSKNKLKTKALEKANFVKAQAGNNLTENKNNLSSGEKRGSISDARVK